jgi:hypothetical protein
MGRLWALRRLSLLATLIVATTAISLVQPPLIVISSDTYGYLAPAIFGLEGKGFGLSTVAGSSTH